MKIFILSPYIPYPLDSGGNISQFAVLEELQNSVQITFCSAVYSEIDFEKIIHLKNILSKINFEIIDLRGTPTIEKNNFFTKYRALKRKLKSGLKTAFKKKEIEKIDSFNKNDDFDESYLTNPINIKSYTFFNKLSEILLRGSYDIYQLEFFDYLDLVNLLPENSLKVFVHHEIRFKRLEKSAQISSKNILYTKYITDISKFNELNLLNSFNSVITFSPIDKAFLEGNLSNKIVSIPFPILDKEFLANNNETSFNKIIFVGGENHFPNQNGVLWFIKNCFEAIWEKHKLPFYIIGAWNEETKLKYESNNKIIFTGFVEDITVFSKKSISISPIFIGSGIRTKILYAMANKTPIVCTSVGAEGIPIINGEHVLVADSIIEFINSIDAFLTNSTLAHKLINNSFYLAKSLYTQQHIAKQRIELYQNLISSSKNI